jgi:anaerobic C4-dicarboxylate transporter
VFSGLKAGDYTITVIDGLGCISAPSATITIGEPTKLNSISISIRITCINDATVTLSATGGTDLMNTVLTKIL